MSSKVYIVTSGEYSDYGIRAIFLDKQQVNEYVAELKESERRIQHGDTPFEWSTAQVEEWAVGRPEGLVLTRQWVARIDFLSGAVTHNPCGPSERVYGMVPPGIRSCGGLVRLSDLGATRISYVSAEHAEKLCVEARQEWLRLRAGVK